MFLLVLEDYKHPDIVVSSVPLELDFFYPSKNLAFEFQVFNILIIFNYWKGLQHYKNVGFYSSTSSSLEDVKKSDIQKEEICKEKGKN